MPSDRKTEPPTPRRLRKARRDGDHPVSRPLIRFGALGLPLAFAPLALEALYRSTRAALVDALSGTPAPAADLALRVGALAGPPLAVAALGALCAGAWQTRGVLSAKPLRWDLARLNPFGRGGPGLGARALTLSLALGAGGATCLVAGLILKDLGAGLAHGVGELDAALGLAAESCRRLGNGALAVSLVFAIADGVLAHVRWLERHRMTPDELRQEQREEQGHPELRQARQHAHRELAGADRTSDVSQATLLVLGAPQLAVALRYDPHLDVAPRVIASGSGASAASLEALASVHGVPVEYDTALARALAAVPLDREIPRSRYGDIARALQRAGMFRPLP